ncbi:MAG TPA: type IV pilus assembly protein PilM [Spirochaetia bacterium]|nr:type IV pilus assembly protein PilM [Spirochaetia bacterium]
MSAHFGLDIGSTSIKILKTDGKRVSTISVAINMSGKTLVAMSNAEKITLADQLKDLIKTAGLRGKQVVTSIPESLVYSRVMQFPVMSSPELATAIKWELDQSVPFPPNEVETSWVILDKPDKIKGDEKISVYVVAVPTSVSDAYVQLLELVELVPLRLENEIPALMRAFSSTLNNDNPTILVNIGASGTGLVLAGKEKIFGNYFLPFGGAVMTKLVADAFGLPSSQAESYKRTYGMVKDQLEGKMFKVLVPVIDNLVGELKKMIIAYQNEYTNSTVGKIILTGGGAYLQGLVPYLSESLSGVEIVMGDTFSGMSVDQKYSTLGPVFAIALGLSTDI